MKWTLIFLGMLGVVIGMTMPARRPVPVAGATVAAANPGESKAAEPTPVETVIQRDMNGHFLAHAEVDGEPIRFVVDTGADMVALTIEDARRAGVPFSEAEFEPVARTASGVAMGQRVTLKTAAWKAALTAVSRMGD